MNTVFPESMWTETAFKFLLIQIHYLHIFFPLFCPVFLHLYSFFLFSFSLLVIIFFFIIIPLFLFILPFINLLSFHFTLRVPKHGWQTIEWTHNWWPLG